MPKSKSPNKSKSSSRHQPLGQVISDDLRRSKYAKSKFKPNPKSDKEEQHEDNDQIEGFMDKKTSARIYNMSREQQREEEEEEGGGRAVFDDVDGDNIRRTSISNKKDKKKKKRYEDDYSDDSEDDDDDDDVEEIEVDESDLFRTSLSGGYVSVSGMGLSAGEEEAVSRMMGGGGAEGEGEGGRRTLADIIMEKIKAKEEEMKDG
eukprot:CAMPEP_0118647228 /NCGR_PEP_ID=MMETSP0785-20121206/8494_1 /TAXON_ID=91992 /ORGANISM="Bolidomonas pacifica, Strain CCMP 1866" /LENGTH=204 /DNA_ID=CAMNT_0006539307 /DNA_START=158 /DNA_END=768 /DNA_ORIENTATION=-